MTKFRVLLLTATFLACGTAQSFGQYKVDLVNQQGGTITCVTIGPAAALGKKCVEMFQDAGFVRTHEVGYSGMTIGAMGKDSSVIVDIQSDSAAAHAGLQVGDVITAVEDKPVKPTPGAIAAQAVFGKRGETLHLKVRRGGSEQEVSLVRSAQDAPEGPKSTSKFIMLRPLIDWRGQFIPCMGAGLAASAAIEYCDVHFKPYGYIKPGELGSTGFELDLAQVNSATIIEVEPNSAAATAGIQQGDEIISVEGHPLAAKAGEVAKERLFGKIGDQFHITVRRGNTKKTFVLQLEAKPKGQESASL